ncbi:hypothetical protein [Trebonia sp.]|uniref:hypothetical protein n=1 Tax=Trebonia sp. TaxID=2767075 RepID=UPI00262A6817|nr:hypothetical protein [Trebonia sp.]
MSRVESGLLAPDEAFARACDLAFPAAGGWFARFWEARAKWDTAMPPAFRSFVADEARATALYVFEHSLLPGAGGQVRVSAASTWSKASRCRVYSHSRVSRSRARCLTD